MNFESNPQKPGSKFEIAESDIEQMMANFDQLVIDNPRNKTAENVNVVATNIGEGKSLNEGRMAKTLELIAQFRLTPEQIEAKKAKEAAKMAEEDERRLNASWDTFN